MERLLALVVLISSCASPEVKIGVPPSQATADSKRVLLVVNTASADSIEVGRYYASKRKVPTANVLLVDIDTADNIPEAEFEKGLKGKVRSAINASKQDIDFIVLTKGVPIRIKDNSGFSTDGHLAAMDLPIQAVTNASPNQLRQSINPYFNRAERFSSKKFGFYLVTRLDGYTVPHAKRLVDNSLAAKPQKGPFLFDVAAGKTNDGYRDMHQSLLLAGEMLIRKGFKATVDLSPEFVAPSAPLAGYASWGSNDGKFDLEKYNKLRFKPGALAETFVSTSGRTFRRTVGGQSLVADLIEQGVTGVKGYVSEPYTFALARPQILFDRYTGGYNLAESFYMASPLLKWKDVVIGDPLCSPYAKR